MNLEKLYKIKELTDDLITEASQKRDKDFFIQQGKRGGEKIKERLLTDPDYYKRMGRKSAELRRQKKLSTGTK